MNVETAHSSHNFEIRVAWTGNKGQGTTGYTAYDRAHEISAEGKPVIAGSSDPKFRGDKSRYNPEELLVASLSTCHMLWYLHLCADAGVIVTRYIDQAVGVMVLSADGGGHFTEVTLRPAVAVMPDADAALAHELHARAHHLCFIANSVNFPVRIEPSIQQRGV